MIDKERKFLLYHLPEWRRSSCAAGAKQITWLTVAIPKWSGWQEWHWGSSRTQLIPYLPLPSWKAAETRGATISLLLSNWVARRRGCSSECFPFLLCPRNGPSIAHISRKVLPLVLQFGIKRQFGLWFLQDEEAAVFARVVAGATERLCRQMLILMNMLLVQVPGAPVLRLVAVATGIVAASMQEGSFSYGCE